MTTDTESEQRRPAEEPGGAMRLPPTPDEPYYRERAGGEQRRRWGALLLVVGVVWLVFALASGGSLFPIGSVERSEAIPAQSFAVERVVLRGVNDDFELVGWSEDELQLEGLRRGFGWSDGAAREALERLEVVTTQSGDTLTIEVVRPAGIGGVVGRSPYAELRLSVPAGVLVEARTAGGDIVAEGLRGDATLGTVSGAIEVSAGEGSLTVETTSGDVVIDDFRGPLVANSVSGDLDAAGDLDGAAVETVSGDVSLDGVSGEVSATSISGDIRVDDARDAVLRLESTSGDIRAAGALAEESESQINNISGDVRFELPEGAGLRVEVSTVSGELISELDLRDLVEERRRLSGAIGQGGARLTITTTSGDVQIEGE